MTNGTVGWVQVGTDDPASAKRFYGEMFGWTFAADPDGGKYEMTSYAGADRPHGGLFDTEGQSPNHAIFFVIVSDVEAAAAEAERLGGKVVSPPITTPSGLTFAHLQDPGGNEFGVFTPPAH
jgi:predicted enzyme related to lactoylglutathione lyase